MRFEWKTIAALSNILIGTKFPRRKEFKCFHLFGKTTSCQFQTPRKTIEKEMITVKTFFSFYSSSSFSFVFPSFFHLERSNLRFEQTLGTLPGESLLNEYQSSLHTRSCLVWKNRPHKTSRIKFWKTRMGKFIYIMPKTYFSWLKATN